VLAEAEITATSQAHAMPPTPNDSKHAITPEIRIHNRLGNVMTTLLVSRCLRSNSITQVLPDAEMLFTVLCAWSIMVD